MPTLTANELEEISRFDTCAIANAIERFERRLRNEGTTDGSLQCLFPDRPTVVGYATTATIRASSPPAVGQVYQDRTDWWTHILSVPPPRIVVVQDVDNTPGVGAFVGEVHAQILRALGCIAYVTNGGVRDVPAVRRMGFQMFAGHVAVSHAFAHLVAFGDPVEIAGLQVKEGDLLCGDLHGLVSVPETVARDVAGVAADLLARERPIVDLCTSEDFSLERLRRLIKELS